MADFANFLVSYSSSIWGFVEAMAPYLLFGLLLAGIMHVFLPKSLINKHLAKPGVGSVFKASLLGVPMPLCSCSVIPVAQHLHKSGASKGATLSFVSSTPSTGIDSITALVGMMGPVYALFKVVLSFAGGWLTGLLTPLLAPELSASEKQRESEARRLETTRNQGIVEPSWKSKLNWNSVKLSFEYAYFDLFKDIAKWLFIGTLLGASLEFILPENWALVSNIWLSYGLIILISLPLYVCATGSIPVALALLAQGFSPGAALLFLTLGPATNSATLSWLWGSFGAKLTTMYLMVLASLGLIAAVIMDQFFGDLVLAQSMVHHHDESSLLVTVVSIIFSIIWAYHLFHLSKKWLSNKFTESESKSCCSSSDSCETVETNQLDDEAQEMLQIPISGITCGNCIEKVQSVLDKAGVQAKVQLEPSVVILAASELDKLKPQAAGLSFQGYHLDLSKLESK